MVSEYDILETLLIIRVTGKSTGTPNEKGLQLDAQTVLNYVVTHPK